MQFIGIKEEIGPIDNYKKFMCAYVEELLIAVHKFPTEYSYSLDKVPDVADRMGAAFLRGSYNKDSRAIKAVCKRLNIKFTYQGINAFLKGE